MDFTANHKVEMPFDLELLTIILTTNDKRGHYLALAEGAGFGTCFLDALLDFFYRIFPLPSLFLGT
jgi:hypothetical protein